jgi:hypothetical protein
MFQIFEVMRHFTLCLLFFIVNFSCLRSLTINCKFDNDLFFDDLKVAYTCSVVKLVVTNETSRYIKEIKAEPKWELSPGMTFDSVTQLYIFEQHMTYFPRNFTGFFKNIVALHAGKNKLEYLEKDDIKEFQKLRFLYLYSNKLEFLQSDVLQENKELVYVSLHSNRLKHIGSKMLAPLLKLRTAYFNKNICIDKQAVHNEHDVADLRLEIAVKCSDITDEDLFLNLKENQMRLSQLEEKIDALTSLVKSMKKT